MRRFLDLVFIFFNIFFKHKTLKFFKSLAVSRVSKKILNSSVFQRVSATHSSAFSMIELLFVLVILGILASLALPKISFSRTNALSVAVQNDIQTIISSTQEYAITNNFLPQNATPQWLISYLNLSPQRWVASGDSLKIANNGKVDSANDCLSIRFNGTRSLQIIFNKSVSSPLCNTLFKNYNNDINVPLNIGI